ncbi:MAG: endonuclease/exonuclease/phosphatase family protein [Thermoanaerobaculia bacterium]|nr:endonuclease/exonuclease/phosphatase family protein [Thermoanaerobaculia bacterium]
MKRSFKIGLGFLAVVLTIFAYRIFSVYEFRAGECQAKAAPAKLAPTYPRRLVVMTYNIQGHAALIRSTHIARIAGVINQIRPDIVGINEAHRNTWQSRFRDHVAELQRRTGMNVSFGESYEQMGGQFGNAILTRGKIVSTAVYKLPGAGEPRSLLESIVDIGGGRVAFYVTHLAAWEKLNRPTRANQLECLVRHVRSSRYPFVLTGDLNAPPEAPEIQAFRREIGLQMAGTVDPTHRVLNIQLDYIFADPGWKVVTAKTLDIGPSDHRPVMAELTYEAVR